MRIRHRQNIVGPVTVVAFGSCQVSQLRNLPMKGLEVACGNFLVTSATLIHDMEPEVGQVRPFDSVCGVASAAHRQLFVRASDFGRVDAGGKEFVDSAMASRTRARDVVAVHAGAGIPAGQLAVGSVAIGTIRCHRQTAFQQPLAVDALHVVLYDVILFASVTDSCFLTYPMALSAQHGHVSGIGRRVGFTLSQCSMITVTIVASGRVRIPLCDQLAMGAFSILTHHFGVTDRAVHLLWHGAARPQFRGCATRMTLHARNARMTRMCQLFLVYKERRRAPGLGRSQFAIVMAPLTIPVRHALRVENPPHLVRGMAIYTGRDHVRLLFPQFPLYDFAVDNFDLGVTMRAGFRDVLLGDRRTWIRMRENKVRSVAAGAHGSNNQSAAKQAFTVDAVHVITQDIVLWELMCQLNGGAFTMAVSTQARDLHSRGGRSGSRGTQHIMRAVTSLTARSQAVSVFGGTPMETFGVLRLLVRMTGTTIHWR